jgi:hypothetical protein
LFGDTFPDDPPSSSSKGDQSADVRLNPDGARSHVLFVQMKGKPSDGREGFEDAMDENPLGVDVQQRGRKEYAFGQKFDGATTPRKIDFSSSRCGRMPLRIPGRVRSGTLRGV